MRKGLLRFFSFIFVSALALFLLPTSADAAWTKFPGNPVLRPGKPGEWDSRHVFAPTVLFDGIRYKMWYSGYDGSHWQIGHAISNDGITWKKHPKNPVVPFGSPDGWELDAAETTVIFDDGLYKMWYTSTHETTVTGKERYRIRYAFSEDGINWTKYSDYVLRAIAGSWESEGVVQPHVIKEGSVYKMWYAARDSGGVWRIGHATSPDGVNWAKHANNPVLYSTEGWECSHVGNPSILYEGFNYKMWYHAGWIVPSNIVFATSPDGLNWSKPADENPVLTTTSATFDQSFIATPNVLRVNNVYLMYYAGFNGSNRQIGLASTGPIPPPPPPSKASIVILPGLGASWNYKKIFLGEERPQSEWKMTPFVKHYDNLLATLDAADYNPGEDLFVFNYDWTKPVNQIANDLQNYIDEVVDPPRGESSGKKIKLIGHSLGGLVARAYIQNNPSAHQVEQLITLGSPHKGGVQVYKAWEGADFHDLLGQPMRLGAELLIALRGRNYKNKVEAVRNIVPGLKNLLFIDDYLKKHPTGKVIPEKSYSQRNLWLKNLGVTEELKDLLDTVVGKVGDTLRWLKVVSRSKIDQKLGRWQDGKPVDEEFAIGDKTILASSAGPEETKITELSLDHGDLVRTKEGIETILSLLEMEDTEAIVNSYPPDSPFLVFVLASPGNLKVANPLGEKAGFEVSPPIIPDSLFLLQEKMIVIPGAIDGDYQVEVVGNDETGSYRLLIGQLTEKGDVWQEYQGEIAPSETNTYLLKIDNSLESTPLDLARLISSKLKKLLIEVPKASLSFRQKARIQAQSAKILAEFEPTLALLKFKRNKEAQKLVEQALLDSLSLANSLERTKAVSLLDSSREIIDLLDQLHQLLK